MVKTVSFKGLILRAVLRQVSPLVIRLVSVSDQMPLNEFHDGSEFDLADDRQFDPAAPLHLGSSQTLVPTAPSNRRWLKKGQSSTRGTIVAPQGGRTWTS